MNYEHLTAEELVRQISWQKGSDLELEGELVRRVVAGEVELAEADALGERDEEIADLKGEITELEESNTAKQTVIDELQEKLDKAAEALA